MAQDKDFDAFVIGSSEAHTLVKSGAVWYLDEYPQITSKFDEMFEGIKNIFSYKGKLFGIPIDLFVEALLVDENFVEDHGIVIPDTPWTWDEFYEFSKKIMKKLSEGGNSHISVISLANLHRLLFNSYDISIDFISGDVNYQTPEFENTLKLYKKFVTENIATKDNSNCIFTVRNLDLYMNDELIAYSPAVDGIHKYPANTEMFCVNRYSTNKNKVADFMGEFLSKELQITAHSRCCLYKDMDLYRAEFDNYLKTFGPSPYTRYLSNDINYNIYANVVSNSVPNQLAISIKTLIDTEDAKRSF